jgi:hypothetical protein
MASWWHHFEVHAEAAELAMAGQHLAAATAGEPWPPQYTREPSPSSATGPERQASLEDELVPAQPARDDTSARLDELQARVDRAAQRVATQETGRQASSDYASRIEREAQAEPEQQAEIQAGAEIEL